MRLGFRASDLGFRVLGLGFRAGRLRVHESVGSGFRTWSPPGCGIGAKDVRPRAIYYMSYCQY